MSSFTRQLFKPSLGSALLSLGCAKASLGAWGERVWAVGTVTASRLWSPAPSAQDCAGICCTMGTVLSDAVLVGPLLVWTSRDLDLAAFVRHTGRGCVCQGVLL